MSAHSAHSPISIHDLRAFKERGEQFAMLTAYDALTAEIFDAAGVPALLVGDSLSMVVLGHDSTLPVTMEQMLHHTQAVSRGARRALVIGDMPFMSYQASDEDGLRNGARFLQEAGAHAVKLEGGQQVAGLVARMTRAGIPVMGHLGLTPQSVRQLGGFKVQGRTAESADRIVDDAVALTEAGAFAIVLECVPAEVALRVTEAIPIPTVGIGAGPHCDGQVLVADDMLGITAGRLPRFVKQYADVRMAMTDAAKSFQAEVASGDYPGPEHTYES